jgi:hypothetical protein
LLEHASYVNFFAPVDVAFKPARAHRTPQHDIRLSAQGAYRFRLVCLPIGRVASKQNRR